MNEKYSDDARAFLHSEITRLIKQGLPHDAARAAAVVEARKRGLKLPEHVK